MTFKALLKRLQKMTPEQLKKPAILLEGCSGNWTEVQGVYVARKDEYDEEFAPGERRHQEFVRAGITLPPPAAPKGSCYMIHDH